MKNSKSIAPNIDLTKINDSFAFCDWSNDKYAWPWIDFS